MPGYKPGGLVSGNKTAFMLPAACSAFSTEAFISSCPLGFGEDSALVGGRRKRKPKLNTKRKLNLFKLQDDGQSI